MMVNGDMMPPYYDDLSTMDDYEEQLENEGIESWEEGFIRGFLAEV